MSDSFWTHLRSRTTEHRTALSREECVRRLRDGTDGYFAWSGAKPARAMVFSGGALLVSTFLLANHAPVSVGLADDPPGTRIRIRTGPMTTILLIVLTLGILGIVGGTLGAGVAVPQILTMVLILALLGFAVLAVTAMVTRGPHARLREFVVRLCEATPA